MKHTSLKALIALIVSLSLSANPYNDHTLASTVPSVGLNHIHADTKQEHGPFSGCFDLAKKKYNDPLLISSTDSIGVKFSLAQSIGHHNTTGFDLVAHCVNSLVAQGAEPLFFLNYCATEKFSTQENSQLLMGIVAACRASNCSLNNTHTIEMPGIYQQGAYNVTGFAVGIVERECVLPHTESIKAGDILIGLTTTGIHANGFSRVARAIQDNNIDVTAKSPFLSYHATLAHALLEPSTLYVSILPLCKTNTIKAIAHTAHSLIDTLDGVIPNHLGAHIDIGSWYTPPFFRWIKQLCAHDDRTMAHAYNLGIGMVLIASDHDAQSVINSLKINGIHATKIGAITAHSHGQRITLHGALPSHIMRLMVIGSGGGEHALAWKLAQSQYVGIVCVVPGNGGTSHEPKVKNIPINLSHTNALIAYAQHNKIDIIISDNSCNTDFVDACAQQGIRCIGPHKKAVELTKSAHVLGEFCTRHAIAFMAEPQNTQRIVVAALTDGTTITPFSNTMLYRNKFNGDKGEITDGMGAYSPISTITHALEQQIMKEIFIPLLRGMQLDGIRATGFMHATIMLDHAKPYIASLQFGLGDPQTQTILMRLKTDLCLLCNAAYDGQLERVQLEWDTQTAVSTIVALSNYPAQCKTGDVIVGVAHDLHANHAKIFHCATAWKNEKLITNGGRVLCATALGKTLNDARNAAYDLIKHVYWPDMHYRIDIGYSNN